MSQTPHGGGARIHRAVSATIGMIVSAAVAVFLLVDAFWRGGFVQGMLLTPWVLLAVWAVYVFAYAPHVRTDATGLRLHNVLRIADIPWGRVAAIALRWQVEVTLTDGRVLKAFGGPTQGRPRKPRRETPESDAPAVPSAVRDIAFIQEEWERAQERGTGDAPVRIRPDVPALVALFAILTWTLTSLLIVSPWA
ncbi:PH domain-containing protein [Microbacterium sp. SS28]|uniref:PH domain-containing protein n=1 Tax=Microbacterium sp. SS28 TaxID=2919948 RepID=UPI001FAB1118|nr:PH domain-containing protein [Microbacterium sp. SS28]